MHAKLVVVGGDAKAAVIRLKLPAIVGRGRNASLTLPHPLVSRQHCEIVESNGQLLVRDLGSLNGTFIGKERITEAILPPGELLTIGAVTFRAVYDVPASDAESPPENRKPTVDDQRGDNGQVTAGRKGTDAAILPVDTGLAVDQDREEPLLEDSLGTEPVPGEPAATGDDEMDLLPPDEEDRPAAGPAEYARSAGPAEPADAGQTPPAEEASLPATAGTNTGDGDDEDEDVDLLHDDSFEELHLGEAPDDEDLSTIEDLADTPAEANGGTHDLAPLEDEPREDSASTSDAVTTDEGEQGGELPRDEKESAEDLDDDLRSFLRKFQ